MRGNFELWTLQVDAEAYVGTSMTVGQDTIFHQYIAQPQSVWFPDNTQQKNIGNIFCAPIHWIARASYESYGNCN